MMTKPRLKYIRTFRASTERQAAKDALSWAHTPDAGVEHGGVFVRTGVDWLEAYAMVLKSLPDPAEHAELLATVCANYAALAESPGCGRRGAK